MSEGVEPYTPEQIHFDWPDMSAPPNHITRQFWINFLEKIKEQDIKRVYVCCTAGQGRTGTALSCFLVASGLTDDSLVAIEYIRRAYSSHAIERACQEKYIDFIAFGEIAFEKDFRSKLDFGDDDDSLSETDSLPVGKGLDDESDDYDDYDEWGTIVG